MKKLTLLLFVLFSIPSFGQKQVNKHSGVWLGYFNQTDSSSLAVSAGADRSKVLRDLELLSGSENGLVELSVTDSFFQ